MWRSILPKLAKRNRPAEKDLVKKWKIVKGDTVGVFVVVVVVPSTRLELLTHEGASNKGKRKG
jgi:hypothetical protein